MSGAVGILLAAGFGRRFVASGGGNKLLHPFEDGLPVGLRTARVWKTALDKVLAVVRPEDAILAGFFRQAGCEIVNNSDALDGMGTSVAAGVAACPNACGWIVGLADMPYVSETTILALSRALAEGASLAAPYFQGQRGQPVAFSARYRDELLALQGDAGAREILKTHAQHVLRVEVDDRGILRDIDTLQDLAAV